MVLEPDSLPNLVTNIELPSCAAAEQVYRRGVAYAISKLSLPNVFIYLDAAHAGWLGWPKNLPKAVAVFKEVLADAGGADRIRGFAVNVSNYDPAREPAAKKSGPDDPSQDELGYVDDLAAGLAKVGITGKGYIIDTSRNGKGESARRPATGATSRARASARARRAAPAPNIDAYFWVKTPGESDGTADRKASRFDENCVSDDAMPGAPEAGELFAPYLIDLAKNAQPAPLGTPPSPARGRGSGEGDLASGRARAERVGVRANLASGRARAGEGRVRANLASGRACGEGRGDGKPLQLALAERRRPLSLTLSPLRGRGPDRYGDVAAARSVAIAPA